MGWNISTKHKINALLVVAHPDDETIFCGGTLLKNKHFQWTIITATYQSSDPRYKGFEKAMSRYSDYGVNIKSFRTLGLKDGKQKKLSPIDWRLWRHAFTTIKLSPDLVITHNTIGEYGHPDHQAANRISHELFLRVWEIICPGAKNYPQPMRSEMKKTNLSRDVLKKKKKIFDSCYPSESYIYKNLPDIMEYEFEKGPEVFTSKYK